MTICFFVCSSSVVGTGFCERLCVWVCVLSNVSTFHTKLKSYKDVKVSQLFCGFLLVASIFILSRCSGCCHCRVDRPLAHVLRSICEDFACLIWFSLPISHNLPLEMEKENNIECGRLWVGRTLLCERASKRERKHTRSAHRPMISKKMCFN